MYIIYNNNKEILTPETLKKAEEFANSDNNPDYPYFCKFSTEIEGEINEHQWNIIRHDIVYCINSGWDKKIITMVPVINF